jgi:hypothetical protein
MKHESSEDKFASDVLAQVLEIIPAVTYGSNRRLVGKFVGEMQQGPSPLMQNTIIRSMVNSLLELNLTKAEIDELEMSGFSSRLFARLNEIEFPADWE